MKKRIILFIVLASLLYFFVLYSSSHNAYAITGEAITGLASSQATNVSLFIIANPSIVISSPLNKTYLSNSSLSLNYTATNTEYVWYNINNGNNVTINSSLFLQLTEGSHTLYMFANNSGINYTTNVSFTINLTLLRINYTEYNGSYKGSSTNFGLYTYEELINLSNVILENAEFGKIKFNEYINLKEDISPNDGITDLDYNTNISFNNIDFNITALPNMNKQATLWLYNLTFTTPRVLKDGSVCSASICTQESYSGGTIKFNVTQLGLFTIEETPVTPPVTPPGGGGGGGAATVTIKTKTFEVKPELLSVMLKQGETYTEKITIKNIDNIEHQIDISTENLKQFITVKEPKITLKPGEEKIIEIEFSDGKADPETYSGRLKVETKTEAQQIPVVINLKSKNLLFDVRLHILPDHKEVKPGKIVTFNVELFSLGDVKNTNLTLKYYIKDFNGQVKYKTEEVVYIKEQLAIQRSINVPKDLPEGEYILAIDARFNPSVGTASDIFYVLRPTIRLTWGLIIAMILSILILATIITLGVRRNVDKKIKEALETQSREIRRIREKIDNKSIEKSEATTLKKKLKDRMELVEKSYQKGYISKEAYQKSKERLAKTCADLEKKCL